jgi:hypothetical protein
LPTLLGATAPAAGTTSAATPSTIISRLPPEKVAPAAAGGKKDGDGRGGISATSQGRSLTRDAAGGPQKPPVPAPNHILCAACHGVARPYVLMTRPPAIRDEFFLQAPLQARLKAVRTWEKLMSEAVKTDQNKALVIVEVGGDRRMDPSRAYGEKLYKTMKASRCIYVRISPVALDVKAGKKEEATASFINVTMSAITALTSIDRMISDRIRKR